MEIIDLNLVAIIFSLLVAFDFCNELTTKFCLTKTQLFYKHLPILSSNRNTRKRCGIYSQLTIKTPEQHHYRHISFHFLMPTVDFKKINFGGFGS